MIAELSACLSGSASGMTFRQLGMLNLADSNALLLSAGLYNLKLSLAPPTPGNLLEVVKKSRKCTASLPWGHCSLCNVCSQKCAYELAPRTVMPLHALSKMCV